MTKARPQAINTPDSDSVGFMDKRLIIFIFIVVTGLLLSASLLISVDTTSKVHDQLRSNNQLLLTTQELQIQFNRARASITTFMFLGSDQTWQDAMQEVNKLTGNIKKLSEMDSQKTQPQKKLVTEIATNIANFRSALPPLRSIRQNNRGVVEGVLASNINQSKYQYSIVSSLSNAIENLSHESPPDKDLIIKIQSVQNLWLKVVMEFRSLLLLRSPRAKQSTLLYVERFSNEWSALIKNIDNYNIEIQSDLEVADKNQKIWISKLPGVINTHMGKRWRRDLRYMQENLTPISTQILSVLNRYEIKLNNGIRKATSEILVLEKRNIIWVFIVMGLITAFSLIMVLTYKRLLAAQLRKRVDAERINNMKTEFLSTISHELRTPLNAIMGFAQLLDLNPEENLTALQKQNINEINLAGAHLLHLVNEILDLSAIEAGHIKLNMKKLDICKQLNDSIFMSREMAIKYGVSINYDDISKHTHFVNADPMRLQQVFLNLISNAIKYNREDGSVNISVKIKSNCVRISVSDTGYGIKKQDIDKLFQPFERLDKDHKIDGVGIGLAITKEIIESMDGEIGATSDVGSGSTFWIEFASI